MVTTLVNANIKEVPRIDLTKGGKVIQGSQKGEGMDANQLTQLKAVSTVQSTSVENDSTIEVVEIKVKKSDWQLRLSQLLGQKANMEAQYQTQMDNINTQISQIQDKIALFNA